MAPHTFTDSEKNSYFQYGKFTINVGNHGNNLLGKKGAIHNNILPQGDAVVYCETLKTMLGTTKQMGRYVDACLLNNNTHQHRCSCQIEVQTFKWEIFAHPTYKTKTSHQITHLF